MPIIRRIVLSAVAALAAWSHPSSASDRYGQYVYHVVARQAGEEQPRKIGIATLIDRRGLFVTAGHLFDEDDTTYLLRSKDGEEVAPLMVYRTRFDDMSEVNDWALVVADLKGAALRSYGVDADNRIGLEDAAKGNIRIDFDHVATLENLKAVDLGRPGAAPADDDPLRPYAQCEAPRLLVGAATGYRYGHSGAALVQDGRVVAVASRYQYSDLNIKARTDAIIAGVVEQILQRADGERKDQAEDLLEALRKAEDAEKVRVRIAELMDGIGAIVFTPVDCILREYVTSSLLDGRGGLDALPLGEAASRARTMKNLAVDLEAMVEDAGIVDLLQFVRVALSKFRKDIANPHDFSHSETFFNAVRKSSQQIGIHSVMSRVIRAVYAEISPTGKFNLFDAAIEMEPASPGSLNIVLPEEVRNSGLRSTSAIDLARDYLAVAEDRSQPEASRRAARRLAGELFAVGANLPQFGDLAPAYRSFVFTDALKNVQALREMAAASDPEAAAAYLPAEFDLALLATGTMPNNAVAWDVATKTFADRGDWTTAWYTNSAGAALTCDSLGPDCPGNSLGRRLARYSQTLGQRCDYYKTRSYEVIAGPSDAADEFDRIGRETLKRVQPDAYPHIVDAIGLGDVPADFLVSRDCAPVAAPGVEFVYQPPAALDGAPRFDADLPFARAWSENFLREAM